MLSIIDEKLYLKFTAVFLSVFLLFNSYIFYQFTESPLSVPLNPKDPPIPIFDDSDISAGKLIANFKDPEAIIYTDLFNAYLFTMFTGVISPLQGTNQTITTHIPKSAYLFFGKRNLIDEEIILEDQKASRQRWTIVPIKELNLYKQTLLRNKIYNNGDGHVYSKITL